MSKIKSPLNTEQLKAVNFQDGHVCIIAGAGSGKTRCLIERIGRMLRQGVDPTALLAFTFTRKAAEEMRERLRVSNYPGHNEIYCGTIHATLWGILQKEIEHVKGYRQLVIIKQWQQKKILKEIFDEYKFNDLDFADPKEMLRLIGLVKNIGLHPQEYEEHLQKQGANDEYINYAYTCYAEYERHKMRQGSIDFDDMLLLTRDLFLAAPNVLKKYQQQWRYISVDEYQDINVVQEEIIDLLQKGWGNLFVIGDARQCFPGDTIINTSSGPRRIDAIKRHECVLVACGEGKLTYAPVDHVFLRTTREPLVTIVLANGKQIKATPGHVFFAQIPEEDENLYIPREATLIKKVSLYEGETYSYQVAANIQPGMILPIVEDGKIKKERVVHRSIADEIENVVYDLSIPTYRNFVANNIIVHNSIYGFRGSEPQFILNFKDKYPDTKIISLPRNYRSGEKIISLANQLIAKNPEGQEAMLCETGREGEIEILEPFYGADDEAEEVIEKISQEGKPWQDIAVLYRCNHQSRVLEDALIRKQIPYEIIGSEGFYGRKEIKDLIAYMYLALEWDELKKDEYFERVYNKPTRYIGNKFLEEWHEQKVKNGAITVLQKVGWRSVNRRSIDRVLLFYRDLRTLREKYLDSPTGFIAYIRAEIGYDEWYLRNEGEEANDNEMEALSNLNEFSASAENFRSVQSMLNYIEDVIRRTNNQKEEINKVRLMSCHRAKGLEFPIVYVVGMHENLLPHSRSLDLKEERRLCYVAITRAKEKLVMSWFSNHNGREIGPSPFFSDMGLTINPEIAETEIKEKK